LKSKLAWFSPLPSQRSLVAAYTDSLREHLSVRFELRHFAESGDGFYEMRTGRRYRCQLGQVPRGLIRAVNHADVPIYHIADDPRLHAHTWFLSRRKPGLLLLHDTNFYGFVSSISRRISNGESFTKLMGSQYGPIGAEAAAASWGDKIPATFMAEHFPFTSFVVGSPLAVIVHTAEALRLVTALTTAPAFLVPLQRGGDGISDYVNGLHDVVAQVDALRRRWIKIELAARVGRRLVALSGESKIPAGREAAYAEAIADVVG
jgi:hypothetical protein